MGYHFVIGIALIFIFEGMIYQTIWFRMFYFVFRCCFKADEDTYDRKMMDNDVFVEAKRIAGMTKKDLPVRVHKLKKVFKIGLGSNLTAVNNVSFGLESGECFALLGVNGAGKTTTFKSLTNDLVPTSGEISISGFNA